LRVLLQRVREAAVIVDEKTVGEIQRGLVILVGARKGDQEKDARFLAEKVVNLRIFEDQNGKMNLSALDLGAEILAVSQFTLYADTQKGRRPSFVEALEPEPAEQLYRKFVENIKSYGLKTASGIFGAEMLVKILNDGPVTLMLES
jgi:D-tyrosyl-tRNA(Tyr) deacylase